MKNLTLNYEGIGQFTEIVIISELQYYYQLVTYLLSDTVRIEVTKQNNSDEFLYIFRLYVLDQIKYTIGINEEKMNTQSILFEFLKRLNEIQKENKKAIKMILGE